jgi:hypothetical protein
MFTFKDFAGKEIPPEHVYGMVGPGWKDLLDRTFAKLYNLGWDGGIEQVKEKFGGLRIYMTNSTAEMDNLAWGAEGESLEICEDCGAPGTRHYGWSWIRTQCHACNAKRCSEDARKPFRDGCAWP